MPEEKKCVFYCELDFYSTPQVLLIVSNSKQEAEESLDNQLKGYGGVKPQLKELNLCERNLIVIEPPGDRQFK